MLKTTKAQKATKKAAKRTKQTQVPLQACPEALFSQARALILSPPAALQVEEIAPEFITVSVDGLFELELEIVTPGVLVAASCHQKVVIPAVPATYVSARLELVHLLRRWYQFEKVLGNGCFAETLLFTTKCSGRKRNKIAVKTLYNVSQNQEMFKKFELEVERMEKLKGYGHVVQINRAKVYGDHYAIFMEYADEGTLQSFMSQDLTKNGLSEKFVSNLVFELTLGMAACEKEGIVHCDIKEDNIFVHSNRGFLIGDFGQAKSGPSFEYTKNMTLQSWLYRSPEACVQEGVYGHGIDVFCLGPLAIMMLSGLGLKFTTGYESDLELALQEILGDEYRDSESMRSFLAAVLVSDPAQRPSAMELLEHEWFAKFLDRPRYKKSLAKLRC